MILFKKIEVKSKDDLPKESGTYIGQSIGSGVGSKGYIKGTDDRKWVELVEWYQIPVDINTTILNILSDYQVQCQLDYHKGTVPDAEEWFANNFNLYKI